MYGYAGTLSCVRINGYGWMNVKSAAYDVFWGEVQKIFNEFAAFLKEPPRELRKISENELFEVWG